MNARLFALALIALLIGFGVGFISSYLIFQQQIVALRMKIKELQEQLFDLKSAYSNISALSEMQNDLNELKSVLSEIILLLQQVLSKENARIEKLEFIAAYAVKSDAGFNVTLSIKNTGFSDAMIQVISS
ncbi:MAG: hypothetical protein QXJ19_06750 [Candidatus Bathyarchaeia archaeon]|nr:hypothetical protein [Candidatus Bathyarchaeota archaeon]